MPHPRRARLAAVKLAAVFPVELLLHALVIHIHPPYLVAVTLLAVTTTLLVIWVVEPSAMRALAGWLHAPELRRHQRFLDAGVLWRVRVTVADQPGALARVAEALAGLDASILDVDVHGVEGGARDELVVAAPEQVPETALVAALEAAGGRAVVAWPTTALALVDGPTKALALAARVAENPDELAFAVAELLMARVVWEVNSAVGAPHGPGESTLRLPAPGPGLLVVIRPVEPFTAAEAARAYRLAQIAEVVSVRR